MDEELWIFGYGSLVWRPSFPFAERRAARVDGWARRFWQGSTDHRGVPGAPGRVVTLVREEGVSCHGVAYRLEAEAGERVLAHLDHREKGGYERRRLELWLRGAREPNSGLLWLATEDNRNYLGPAPLEEIADQVRVSRGPSGTNREYVLRLAEALRGFGVDDAEVFELEALVR
jgi:cation transport protein ChaC